jgi:CBS domain-containing protein
MPLLPIGTLLFFEIALSHRDPSASAIAGDGMAREYQDPIHHPPREEGISMLKIKISDVMTREVFTLDASTPAETAAWELSVRGFTGAPVRDARGRLVGVLSRSDLTDPERVQGDLAGKEVQDLMTPALFSLDPSESVNRAIRLMVREGIRRVLVMEKSGVLVGIITASDILRQMAWGAVDADLPYGTVEVPAAGSRFAPI